jgi:hypothetical protein
VVFDSIAHVSSDGRLLDKWSSYENLKDLQKLHFPSLLDRNERNAVERKPLKRIDYDLMKWNYPLTNAEVRFGQGLPPVNDHGKWYEYYHINSIQALPETALGLNEKRFQKGNWLISLRNVDLICILDKDTHQVVWSWGPGILDGQHMPRMLSNGNILVFDNGVHRTYSRLIIIDPVRKKIVWEYKSNPPQNFYSNFGGSAQELPNGNFLICDTINGRAFEITPGGGIVWDFLNPKVTNEGKRRVIYRMTRISKEEVSSWLWSQ